MAGVTYTKTIHKRLTNLPMMVAIDVHGRPRISCESELIGEDCFLVGVYTRQVSYHDLKDDINEARKEIGIRAIP